MGGVAHCQQNVTGYGVRELGRELGQTLVPILWSVLKRVQIRSEACLVSLLNGGPGAVAIASAASTGYSPAHRQWMC